MTGVVPVHAPLWQASVCVQGLPSLHWPSLMQAALWSKSSTPSRSRSMPSRVPEPLGTPMNVSVPPPATFARSAARVNGP